MGLLEAVTREKRPETMQYFALTKPNVNTPEQPNQTRPKQTHQTKQTILNYAIVTYLPS